MRVCINRSGSSVQTAFISIAQLVLAFVPTSKLFTLSLAIKLSAQDGCLSTRIRLGQYLLDAPAEQVVSLVDFSHLIVCQPASSFSSAFKPVWMILVNQSAVSRFDLATRAVCGHSQKLTSTKLRHGTGYRLTTITIGSE
ncbi:MAG: hypothetical protein ABSD72_06105 [Terracidiphilus sp.]